MPVASELDAVEPYWQVISAEHVRVARRLLALGGTAGGTTSLTLNDQLTRRPSLLDLLGLGREVWVDIDAAEYIDRLRDEWRPH